MRHIYLAIVATCLSIAGYAQSTLLSNTGDGGFETGHTFALNGWTAVNDSSNMWVVNDLAGAFAGGRSAYISTTGSGSYDYTNSAARTSHFYRDIAIPAGATGIQLSFRWKGQGEFGKDRFLVYVAPTTVTPVARVPASNSTALSGATLLWQQPNASTTSYTSASTVINNSFAGTTVRLIFTWQNDGSGGTGVPASLDNIGITYVPACAGTPTAGAVSSLFATGCNTYSVTVSLTGNSTGTGFTYQWQSTTDTSSWTNVTGATSSVHAATVTATMYYRCQVTCTNSGLSASTPAKLYTSTTPTIVYASLPFTESFESGWVNNCGTSDVPSTNWRNTPGSGNNSWRRSDDTLSTNSAGWTSPTMGRYSPLASSGTHSARFHTYFASTGSVGTMDLYVNMSSGGMKQISYSYINTSGTDKLKCQISTDGGTSWTTIDSPGTTATSWTTRTAYTSATSATAIVRFHATSDFGVTDIGFDNVSISVCSPPAITGTLVINDTSTTTLTNATAGGTWTSGNTAVATIGSSSGVVTAVSAGTATITYTLASGCYSTAVITVYSSSSLTAATCVPDYALPAEACSTHGINISSFQVTGAGGSTLNDNATCDGTGYLSRTGLAVSMVQSSSYTATIASSGSYSNNVQAWIDFNDDGTFASSESVGGRNDFSSAGASFTIDIPYDAATGVHRMRIVTSYYGTGYSYPTLEPCSDDYYYGEARDYTVLVQPLTPCSGTPAISAAIASPATVCSSSTTTLSATGITTAGGFTYQWQSSADSSSWSNISGATTAVYVPSLTASSYYRLALTCSNSGITSTSTATRVLYTSGCYCTPTYYYGAPASTYQMANYTLNGHAGTSINDNGPTTIPSGGYVDRTSISITLRQNASYIGSMTYTSPYYYYISQAWIDYNDNGNFENSEAVTPVVGAPCSYKDSAIFTLTVPHTATLGLHRMRVRQAMTYGCTVPTYMDACASGDGTAGYYYGMTRDYLVNIAPMPGCSGTPTAGATISSTGAVCSSDSITLSTTGATLASSLSYQWQSSTDSTTWTNISGGTTEIFTTAAASPATYYRSVITCAISGASATSTPVRVHHTSGCACTPSYYYGAPASTYQLLNFTLDGEGTSDLNDNGPTVVPSGGYEDRTMLSVNLKQGGSYSGSQTYTHTYYYNISQVWIDYNDNATFENSEIVTPVVGLDCSYTASASFTLNVPATAATGSHLMRVRQAMTYSCGSTSFMDPCAAGDSYFGYYYGMTRDYIANIQPCTAAPTVGAISGTSVFCQGTTSTLSVMPVGGSWSSSNTSVATVSSAGVVNGVSGGTAVISYSATNGCGSGYGTKTVTINPTPDAGTLSGPDEVAVGSTITITTSATDSTGTWTSSNTAVAAVGSTGIVTPAFAGSTTITYTLTTSCGTSYATKSITVTSATSAYCTPSYYYGATSATYSLANFSLTGSAGTSLNDNGPAVKPVNYEDRSFLSLTMEQGGAYNGSQTYTHSYTSYYNQIWIDFNNNNAFETTESVTGVYGDSVCAVWLSSSNFRVSIPATADTGMHIMRVRQVMSWNCARPNLIDPCNYYGDGHYYYYGVARDYSVRIAPCTSAPAVTSINGAGQVCAGSSTTLTVMPNGGSWSSSNTSVASISGTGTVSGIAAGTTTISYTVSNACGTTVATRVFTVNPLPNAGTITGSDTVMVGQVITLGNSTADAGTWSSTTLTVATIDSYGHVTGILTGSSYITYTTSNVCGTAHASKLIYVRSLASAYCAPSNYYGYNGDYYALANFSVTGHGGSAINDNGPSVRPYYYADRTFITMDVMPGTTYSGTQTYTHSYNYYNSQVWIDFNDNNTFENSETVTPVYGNGCGTPTSSSAFTLAIPATANPGVHVMRVRQAMTNNCTMTATMNPCSYGDSYATYYYGMARDYAVNVLTPTACTGTPTAGTATSSVEYACTTTNIVLNLSGATIASGLSYQWQTSPDGTTWTNIAGATTYPYTFTGLAGTTYFRNVMTCGSASANSTPVLVTSTPCYCVPYFYYAYDACNTYQMNIARFIVAGESGTQINDSASCNGTGYVPRLGLSATLQQGAAYTAQIRSSSTSYNQNVQVWIDFDNNGTFSSSETVGGYNNFYNTLVPFTLNIPAGVSGGMRRMRVLTTYYYNSYPTLDPCGNTYYGDARDYMVNITTSSACSGMPIVSPLNATVTTGCTTYTSVLTFADSSITAPLGLTYQWQTATDTASWTNISGATNTSYTATVSTSTYYRCVLTCTNSGLTSATPARRLLLVSPPSVTGSAVLCKGSYTSLYGTPYGGTWSTTDSNATVNSAGTVYGTSAGTAVITYTYSPSGAGCYATATVTVLPTPATFSVTGGGSYCSGGAGVNVGLGGSDAGFSYTLYNGYYPVGSAVSGTGSALNFGLQTGAGTYTVLATNTTTGCTAAMTGYATVTIDGVPDIAGASALCVGGTVTFTNSAAGGTWSSSSAALSINSSTGVATGISTGTATISYVVSSGCQTSRVISVNSVPAAITGTAKACVGSYSLLSNTMSGGTWSSSNASVANVDMYAGYVYGITPGTATITYSAGAGCTSTKQFTVNSLPGSITGADYVCIGLTETMSDTTTGGIWSTASSVIASINAATGEVLGIGSGSTTISYILPTGCYSTKTFIVNPLPAYITGSRTVCVGKVTNLATITPDGTWSSGNPSVATVNTTGAVTGVATGVAVISYILSTGCVAVAPVTVNALPSPITGPSSICVGTTTTFHASSGSGTWSSSNATVGIIGSATGILNGFTAGVTTVTYTRNSTGCAITKDLTVNSLPPAITGTLSLCVGATASLSNAVSGGTWTSSNTTSLIIDTTTGVASAIASGSSVITYVAPTGCRRTANATVSNPPAVLTGVMSACIGGTTTLASLTTGGTWSSGNTAVATAGAGGVVTGVAAGTVTISYTSGAGCVRTATVTINPLPASITGAATVCIGQTITLNSTSTGGSWSAGGAAALTVVPGTGVVTGAASGTGTVTYTLPTGCRTTTVVTVNSSPAVISGVSSICEGNSTTYTSATPDGTWSSSNAAIAAVDAATGVISGVAAGSATITYTAATGCYRTKSIVINPLPATITGTHAVCAGSNATLSSSSTGGLSWTSSNTSVATVASTGQWFGIAAGTATITFTLGTGCYTTTTVTVDPLPTAMSGTALCAGSTTTLTNGITGGSWVSNTTSVATVDASTGVLNAIASGTTVVTYTLPTGCYRTMNVTVNALPATITGTTTVCPGMTTTLATATGGGTWISGNTAVATIASSSRVVTGISSGTAEITYTLPTGCTTTTVVTVLPAPAAITGTMVLCAGSTATLSSATPSGTWTSGNNTVAIIGSASGAVTAVNAGTVTITYVAGCRTTAVITVNALPGTISGALTLCTGTTTTLGNTVGGGTWSSSDNAVAEAGSSTGIISGMSAGTATITYSLATGCHRTATVTVNGSAAAISGSLSVCTGGTTTLTNATAGGTWQSSNSSVAAVGFSTGIVTGASAGTATITYRATTGCVATAVVTVNASPAAITGAATVCAGGVSTLSNTTSGGTWSSSSTAVADVDGSGVVSGISAGVATITYEVGTGCRAVKTITVTAAPAITGTLAMCAGAGTSLANTSGGGTWVSGNTAVATITSGGVVSGVGAGTSTISYTTGAGCVATTVVTVNAAPAAITGTTTLCNASATTLASATAGGTWSSSNSSIASVDGDGVVTAAATGTATITYTIGAGCRTTTMVSVMALPGTIVGTASTCAGSAILLTSTPAGGTWSSSNTAVATVTSTGSVSGITGGTATITYTLPTGCYRTREVTINPAPAAITGTTTVCIGQPTTLSSATASGTWSSSNNAVATIGSATGVVTGVAVGTARITYTLATGCRATTIVTVNGLPPAITGTATVCEGASTTLANTVSGGTWSSSDASVATIGTAGDVSGIAAGTAAISYTAPTGCTTSRIVTVNVQPSAITGTTSFCAGSGTTLSNSVAGGAWASGTPGIASIGVATGIVSGTTPGTATISYTLSSGCRTTTVVSVNPLPGAISGTLTACVGATASLANTAGGGTWTSGDAAVATVDASTGVVSGVAPGTSVITYTTGAGCSVTAVFTVSSLTTSITGTLSLCTGSSSTLANATSGGTWSSSNGAVATIGASTGVVTAVSAGTTTITYMTGAGCATTDEVTVNALPAAITGTSVVCAGGTATLTSTTTGGTWSSGSAAVATVDAASGVVTGVSTGTAVITYTTATGCAVTSVFTVNNVSAITGATALCEGATATLSNSATGGTWASSDAAVAAVGSATGIVTATGAGVVTITYTTPAGCAATADVTVNAAPAAITGSSSVCAGEVITLSNTTGGGSWSSSAVARATIGSATGILSGLSAGTTVVSYTLSSGCASLTTITVNALPAVISGATAVCEGSTMTLTNATTGGTWSSGNMAVATVGTSGIVTAVSAGTADISYTLASGCSRSAAVTVNAAPAAIGGSSTVCAGSSVTLSNSVAAGTWSGSNITVTSVNATTGVVTGLAAGTSTITYAIGSCRTTMVVTVTSGAGAITGTARACIGLTTTLTHGSAGGTWTSSNTGIATIDAATGVATGVTAGTAVISYATVSGCVSTVVFTVNANPPAITGTLSTCIGSTTLLSNASTVPGTWASGTMSVATITGMGYVTGVSAGTSLISFTTSTGCRATATVTINGSPAAIVGPNIVCIGTVATMTNAVAGGTWSSANTAIATIGSATGLVDGVSAGVIRITYSTGAGCFTTKFITVNAAPGAIGGNANMCVGTTSPLTYSSMGTWSSSNTAVASLPNPSTGQVFGVSAGTAFITYTGTATGCSSTRLVTVHPFPSAISGPSNLCHGETATMTHSSTVGTWSSNVVVNIGSATGIVTTNTQVGTATITYSINSACRVTKNMTVGALPAVFTATASVCAGAATTIGCTTAGGTWTSSNSAVATVGSVVSVTLGRVVGVSAGTANITYTITNTGCYRTTIATVNPTPNAGVISSSSGGFALSLATLPSITLSSSGDVGGTWSSSNAAVATIGAGTGVVNAVAAGSSNISYTVTLGSCTARATRSITVTAAREDNSAAAQATTQVFIYPNPTTGTFSINTADAGVLNVFTVDGKIVTNYTVQAGENNVELPKDLAAGIYMCRFNGNNGSSVIIRLVLER